jgi:hypothetical protein
MHRRDSCVSGMAAPSVATRTRRHNAKPITDKAMRDAYKAFLLSPLNSSPGPLKHSRRQLVRGDAKR